MKSSYSPGLRIRIAVSLGVVLMGFILLTSFTLSSLVRVASSHDANQNELSACDDELREAREHLALRLETPVLLYLCTGAALSLVLGVWMISRIVVRPLSQITEAVEQVAAGSLDIHVPIEGSGELVKLGISFNEMTRTIKQQQDNLICQLRAIESANAELMCTQDRLVSAARLASVGTLAAGVAHEIGNPITGVLGLLDAIENESNPETVTRYRQLIAKEVRRVDRIIAELLDYARPSRNESLSTPDTVLLSVLTHVTELLKAQQPFDGIDLRMQIPSDLPAVPMPAEDTTQLLVNLLLNAAQAMNGAGVVSVQASVQSGGKEISLIIEDNGPGIEEACKDLIFDPFFSRRKNSGGSGLGLAICQRICQRADGEIRLDRTFEGGARFVITLPLRQ